MRPSDDLTKRQNGAVDPNERGKSAADAGPFGRKKMVRRENFHLWDGIFSARRSVYVNSEVRRPGHLI